jgi:hypothetical protein
MVQLDLLAYRAPQPPLPGAPRRRTTLHGLDKGVRIRVRGNGVRSADRGTVAAVLDHLEPPKIRYCSDRNGGMYDVALERVSILRRPRLRKPARTEEGS